MLIDVHTHAFHPKIADKVLTQLEDHYDIHPQGTGLVEDLVTRLGAAGLDKAVVHTAATAPAQVVPANNWSIFLQRTFPELYAFGTLHPGFKDNWRELERLEAEGIRGIKLHPDFQGFRLDDPALYPLLDAVGDRFALMVHIGDRLPPEDNPSCPIKLAAIIKDFPDSTFIAAHLGGYLHWSWALDHIIGRDVYIDTSSCLDFIDDDLLGKIFSRHPRERILFGSDYPLFEPGQEIRKLERRLKLGSRDLETLLTTAGTLFREP